MSDSKNVMEIKLNLNVDEVNTILRVLGLHPFQEVASLIIKIKQQGEPQVAAAEALKPQLSTATN